METGIAVQGFKLKRNINKISLSLKSSSRYYKFLKYYNYKVLLLIVLISEGIQKLFHRLYIFIY